MNLPSDNVILLSLVNTKLRDFYPNPDVLCEDMELDRAELEAKLESIGYRYDEKLNRFV